MWIEMGARTLLCPHQMGSNKLWLNTLKSDGEISFRDYGIESGLAGENVSAAKFGGGNTFFHDCGDYNLDGIIDVVEGNLKRPFDDPAFDWSSVLTGKIHFFRLSLTGLKMMMLVLNPSILKLLKEVSFLISI